MLIHICTLGYPKYDQCEIRNKIIMRIKSNLRLTNLSVKSTRVGTNYKSFYFAVKYSFKLHWPTQSRATLSRRIIMLYLT